MVLRNRPMRVAAFCVMLAGSAIMVLGARATQDGIEQLRTISQDNVLWSATQMEVELHRFQRALLQYHLEPTEERLEDLRERFDILWSRTALMTDGGRVGEILRSYDPGHGTLEELFAYLQEIDPTIASLAPGQPERVALIGERLADMSEDLRLYTLRVVRGDTAAAAAVRDVMMSQTQRVAVLSVLGLIASAIALAALSRRHAAS